MEFVKREEDSKSSDFSVQLMIDKKSERVTKYNDKSSVFPAVKVKKTSAQIENSNCRTGVGKLYGSSFPVKDVIEIMTRLLFLHSVLFAVCKILIVVIKL